MDEPEWFKWMTSDGVVRWVRTDSIVMMRGHPERERTTLITHSGHELAVVPMRIGVVAERFFGVVRE